jgi:hypothetical protein
LSRPQASEMEDSRGALCRNRRVFGTLERLRCGLAQLLRMGWFQQVHAKSIGSQEIRALLVARKQLLGRLLDVEIEHSGNPARR